MWEVESGDDSIYNMSGAYNENILLFIFSRRKEKKNLKKFSMLFLQGKKITFLFLLWMFTRIFFLNLSKNSNRQAEDISLAVKKPP